LLHPDYYGLVVFNASKLACEHAPSQILACREDRASLEAGITFRILDGDAIALRAADDAEARVGIYNVQGQLVRTLFDESVGRGGGC
jgi:hypothetical protein